MATPRKKIVAYSKIPKEGRGSAHRTINDKVWEDHTGLPTPEERKETLTCPACDAPLGLYCRCGD